MNLRRRPRRDIGDNKLDKLLRETRANYVARRNASYDFDAGLNDIYARARRPRPGDPGSGEPDTDYPGVDPKDSAVRVVCDHIKMLEALLGAVTAPGEGPVLPATYFGMARRYLLQLRSGLAAHRLTQREALDLVINIEHDLREADEVLRHQYGLSLEEALHARIGELREVRTDLVGQMGSLRREVMRLFDHDDETAEPTLVPVH